MDMDNDNNLDNLLANQFTTYQTCGKYRRFFTRNSFARRFSFNGRSEKKMDEC